MIPVSSLQWEPREPWADCLSRDHHHVGMMADTHVTDEGMDMPQVVHPHPGVVSLRAPM